MHGWPPDGIKDIRRLYGSASLSPTVRQRAVYDGPKPKGMAMLQKGRVDSREARHLSAWLGMALLALLGMCTGMHVAGAVLSGAAFSATVAPGVARYGCTSARHCFPAPLCACQWRATRAASLCRQACASA